MDLIICIEGAKANTETNIFEELIMQINNRFSRHLRFVSIDALNQKRQAIVSRNLINAINIKYDIATNLSFAV